MLSSSDSEGEELQTETKLVVNPKYRERFEKEQRYKDLQRAKELEAELGSDNDDSESESEDEEAAALSTSLDVEIFHTIKSIRDGDKRIFDKNVQWYHEPSEGEDDSEAEETSGAAKKKTYKDIVRERALQAGADEDSPSEDEVRGDGRAGRRAALAYDREQKALRQSFLDSAKGIEGSDEDSDEGDMLRVRPKTDDERREEQRLLEGALKQVVNPDDETAPEGDKFLYDYMLNKKWNFPKDTVRDDMSRAHDAAYGDEEEDEEELDMVDKFESKYNFRFEELNDGGGGGMDGGVSVMGHARNVEGSVRRVDDRRKKAREARKEGKDKERRQKEAELRRLKNIKKQELEERLHKILAVGGIDKSDAAAAMLALTGEDLDEEWDPAKHEEQMRRQFGDDYYANGEEDAEFAAMVESGRIAQDEEGDEAYLEDYDAGDQSNIVNYEDEGDYEEEDGGADAAAMEASGKDILDSLYKLDYEDIVAGMPCRFKYKQVEREDYGLKVDDILHADDKALNRFVGLKKLAPYYKKREGVDDASKWSKKRKRLREEIKEKMAPLVEEETQANAENAATSSKSKKKSKIETEEEPVRTIEDEAGAEEEAKKKRNRRKKRTGGEATVKLINKHTTGAGNRETAVIGDGSKKKSEKKDKQKKKNKEPKEGDVKKRRLDLYN